MVVSSIDPSAHERSIEATFFTSEEPQDPSAHERSIEANFFSFEEPQDDSDDFIVISNEELCQVGLNEKWRFNAELERFVQSIPKIELHVHLGRSDLLCLG